MFRKTWTKLLPEGSKVSPDGKTAKLPDGQVVPLNPKGRRIVTTETFYTRVNGVVISLTSERKSSKEMEARLQLDALQVSRGLPSQLDQAEPLLLVDQIDRWVADLVKRGRKPNDVQTVKGRVGLLIRLGFETVTELAKKSAADKIESGIDALGKPSEAVTIPKGKKFTPAQVRHILKVSPSGLVKLASARGVAGAGKGKARRFSRAEVETLTAHRGKGLSELTRNHYLTAITGFCRWLSRRGHLERVPSLTRTRQGVDVRPRRILTWAECQRLCEAVETEKKIKGGMGSLARSALYRVAFLTMLRARALREMVVGDLRLTGTNPHIVVRAETDKKRKGRAVPLDQVTAKNLVELTKDKGAADLVWSIPEKIVQALHKDLRLADIQPRNELGVVDLHAMRHSGASHLMAKGISPLLICKIGGWSDTRMLVTRYGHLTPENFGETLKGVWS